MSPRLPRAHDNHPGQRQNDNGGAYPPWWRRAYLWMRKYVLPATLWSFLASVIAVWAVVLHYGDQDAIQQGRKVAIAVSCGATNGAIIAGRQIVLGQTDPRIPVSRFERNLERLGYPSRHVRRVEAQHAADMYAHEIAESVRRTADGKARGLVRPDGTLDCARVQTISHSR